MIAILGISAYYHDSAAALVIDGEVVAAAQEERFTRTKHDASFPVHAIRYVLQAGGLEYNDLTGVAFYDKPMLKFERLLQTYHAFSPRGVTSFVKAMPPWIKDKLFSRRLLRRELAAFGPGEVPLLFPEHHLSHAASAFYPSPFEEAAILTVDGVGEWATTTISHGKGKAITLLKELHFPHSVGLLYSAFTYYLGFKVNSGEYKLMGLAPFGARGHGQTEMFKQRILEELVDLRDDGSFLLNMQYFKYATGLKMTHNARFEKLFGFPRRLPEAPISQEHCDLALAIQEVTELMVVRLAAEAKRLTGCANLVMAGGVALNCVANRKLADADVFEHLWIQPAAGDAGGSVGAALAAYHIGHQQPRILRSAPDGMNHAYLGPSYTDRQIALLLHRHNVTYAHFPDFNVLTAETGRLLAQGEVIGWFRGRAEFGPRALGNRSILADPRDPGMQQKLNAAIKFREGFRPFAPSVLEEDAAAYFTPVTASPYMLFTASLKEELRISEPPELVGAGMRERLHYQHSPVPAVTHVDYSARVQTVSKTANPEFWQLIHDFKALTGCSMLVNTSFNVRGEPIVGSPEDALNAFIRTEMDGVVIGNFLIEKRKQRAPLVPTVAGVRFDPD